MRCALFTAFRRPHLTSRVSFVSFGTAAWFASYLLISTNRRAWTSLINSISHQPLPAKLVNRQPAYVQVSKRRASERLLKAFYPPIRPASSPGTIGRVLPSGWEAGYRTFCVSSLAMGPRKRMATAAVYLVAPVAQFRSTRIIRRGPTEPQDQRTYRVALKPSACSTVSPLGHSSKFVTTFLLVSIYFDSFKRKHVTTAIEKKEDAKCSNDRY